MQSERLSTEEHQLVESLSQPDAPRSGGVHVSDLIQGIAQLLGMLPPEDDSRDPRLYFTVGLAWEAAVLKALRDQVIQLGPLEKDGITGTMDGFHVLDGDVIECKATWTSSRKHPTDNWRWMTQVKAYCHILGTKAVRLYVMYLNGNWKPPAPQMRLERVVFTEEELKDNWYMLVGYRRSREGG